ncbi:MAG: hypothetical protein A2043_11535 [Candidatus Schekmanbacteria bacterium GWA2_38_9]|nr:MAG: hypothetical protein A2043_11535 [Candidatus Schekmanbacteria bacterium GWA2_38_9]
MNIPPMDNFSVTVAIPCFNGEKYLSDNIVSILKQSRKPDEILVVDDGSTDCSAEIAGNFQEVKLIRHLSNLGLAESRNTALKNASGNIIVYLDADIIAHPKLLESLLSQYSSDDIAGVGGRGIESKWGMGGFSRKNEANNIYNQWRSLHASQGFGEKFIDGVSMLWGLCSSYRIEVLRIIGGFDKIYKTNGEDVDIGIKINNLGLKLVYTPDAIVYHRRDDDFDSLREMLFRWYFWGYKAKRKNRNPAFANYMKIILFASIKNIIYDLINKKNPSLALLSLKASGIELKATFRALWENLKE